MKDLAIFSGFALALSTIVGLIILETPVVQINSQGECVAVWSHGAEYSCRHMPKRYQVEYIK